MNQVIEAFLLQNKKISRSKNKKISYSLFILVLYSVSICTILIFLQYFHLQLNDLPTHIEKQDVSIKKNTLLTQDTLPIYLNNNDTVQLDSHSLIINQNQIISYDSISKIIHQDSFSHNELVQLSKDNLSQIKIILFILLWVSSLPFLFTTILFSFILAKCIQFYANNSLDLTYANAYLFVVYASLTPMFVYFVANIATHSYFHWFWLLYLAIAINAFSIIWIKKHD